uniref:Winged helix-turn-helix domain-containing protein n=1 Tax=Rhodopseudomonas palustris (strain DX-1) TaxID=652103 RepID=E6VL71_RHOPX
MNTTSAMVAELNLKPLTKKTLNYLRHSGALTPLVFWSLYGSMALAQQINELRNAGFKVKTTMKIDEEGSRYPSYTLETA